MSDRLLDIYDALLLDLDGTVYRGGEPVPGAEYAVTAARNSNVAVRFVTNNASRAPGDVSAHLTEMGIKADAAEVSTSGQAGAAVLAERLSPGDEVLVIGSDALADEVVNVGLKVVRVAGPAVRAVLQGLSPKTAWADLAEACVAIRGGALWVACNVDRTLPTDRGLLPGNGSLVHALRVATDREPVVAGKPATPLMAESIRSADAARPLVVGDRLDTDIEGAVAAKLDSLLVLTGVATPADVLAARPHERPTYVATDLSCVTDAAPALELTAKPGWTVTSENGLTATGDGDPLDLLRTLCAVHWANAEGPVDVHAGDDGVHVALSALGLSGRTIG
ncbi:HAD-IIA family hydrolase [Actinokineospora sp. HUAS TT18]|uniref:HAD-IIA family hydrolase n=1 Tax=Actinokineospora sp. HUAS TT18 TaxID=3447451 RepID=UPI003F51B721